MKYFFNENILPKNWRIVRSDAVSDHVKNIIRVKDLKDKLFFHYSIPSIQEIGDGFVQNGSELDSDKILLEGGEILVSKLNPEKGTVILSKPQQYPIICSTELVAIKPEEELRAKYALYVYSSDAVRDFLASKAISATKSHKRVEPSDIYKIHLPLPSLELQDQLISVLDKEVDFIDKLRKQKEIQLRLLAEKRQALIAQYVTQGVNSNVRMKDSGIDWLGRIPEHWLVKKIKYLTVKVGSGVTPKGGATVYQKSGIPLLRSQNIHFKGLNLDDVAFISKEIHESMSTSKVYAGDVLLNITGASIGRCNYYSGELGEANVNQHVCILRPNNSITTEYLYMLLSSRLGQQQVEMHQVGGGREGLTFESIKSFIFPLPGIKEQLEILHELKKLEDAIRVLENLTEKSLELLKERRSSLITAAVTGQLETPS
jgi:type I restriction enzyme S subunit